MDGPSFDKHDYSNDDYSNDDYSNDDYVLYNTSSTTTSDLPGYFLLAMCATFLCASCGPTLRKYKDKLLISCTKTRLKSKRFSSLNEDQLVNECSICLEPYKQGDDIIVLKCSHLFHETCIKTWITPDNQTCPYCRRSII
jgi:hypothetical protein